MKLDATPMGCLLVDENSIIIDCNAEALTLFGAKIINRPVFMVVDDETMASAVSADVGEGRKCIYFPKTPENFGAERLRAIFDNMPLACQFCDWDFNIIECNQKCLEIFGFDNKQEYIENFFRLSPRTQPCGAPSMEMAKQRLSAALKSQGGYSRFEWMYRDKSGNELPAEVTFVKMRWLEDNHMLVVIRDLRETYKLAQTERTMKQHMQLMLDSSPLACMIHGKDGLILEANQEAANLFEVASKKELINRFKELSPVYQPDGRLSAEKMQEIFRTVAVKGKTRFGWMHKTLTGSPLPCEIVLEKPDFGDADLMISYVRDLREINHAMSMVQHLEKLAFVDPLTGAHNRRYFMEEAESKLETCLANGEPLSIIMTDIDSFKAVNDTYGHDVGDEVLKIMVARMRHVLRDVVVVARYGGEEFVVLLPGVPSSAAENIAWRLQNNIEASDFKIKTDEGLVIKITASFGVAESNENSQNVGDIIKRADKALYQAKAAGKNTVVVSDA